MKFCSFIVCFARSYSGIVSKVQFGGYAEFFLEFFDFFLAGGSECYGCEDLQGEAYLVFLPPCAVCSTFLPLVFPFSVNTRSNERKRTSLLICFRRAISSSFSLMISRNIVLFSRS